MDEWKIRRGEGSGEGTVAMAHAADIEDSRGG